MARAARVARGDGTVADFSALFVWLRRRSHGQQAVSDIGDFVAHPDHRDTGITLQTAVDLADAFIGSVLEVAGEDPGDPLELLRKRTMAKLRLMPPAEVKRETGLSVRKVRQILKRGLAAASYEEGKFSLNRTLPRREVELLNMFGSGARSRPAFTDADLESQFISAMVANKLFERKPSHPIPDLRRRLSVFAFQVMHGTVLEIKGYGQGQLRGGIRSRPEPSITQLIVLIPSTNPRDAGAFGLPIFECYLPAVDLCDEELLATPNWDCPIEINDAWMLQKIG